jgi:hypothetical protein
MCKLDNACVDEDNNKHRKIQKGHTDRMGENRWLKRV